MVRNVGKWHNIDVVIKSLEKGAITPTMEIRVEVKHLRDLRHPNIASFVGASLDLPNVCILMEMAPKGSLDDLLMNDSINVDWTFKYSLLKVRQTTLCYGHTHCCSPHLHSDCTYCRPCVLFTH
jgi:atrial natriuretic peptide receptor B